MKKFKFLIFISSLLFIPVLVWGQSAGPSTGPIIDNPLAVESLTELLAKVLEIVVQVGLVVIVFFIIFTGFKYVTAQGNTAEITKAHQALMATLIGSAIVLGSYAIAKALESTVNQLKTGIGQIEEINNFKV
ncbi:MAG: hypothetical protein WC385_00755 [Candidatus Paceibacterota bacterium]|jgi:TRAP-type C4-dicarboxylate transport system permease small subunit